MEWINSFNSSHPWWFGMVLNSFLLSLVWIAPKKLLTLGGIVNAWILGVLIWGSLGWQGYTIVGFYFLVGSAVTRIKMQEKEQLGISEKRSGARGWENVWGSALIGAFCALGILLIPSPEIKALLILGYVASFCTKLSDTTASEVGKAYGKSTFLITTLQPVAKGTEGAVSLEGTLAGIFASILIGVLAWGIGFIDGVSVFFCAIAAFVATTIESLIGATLQEKWLWMTNEVVNIINTLVGAVTAILIMFLWQN
jgi:uncharacterized protein (TIGR00297 family)